MIPNLEETLNAHFGFSSFRSGQQEAIRSLLNGQNTLVVMPTGAGKSLIYQFASLQFDGLTLVISPLIALMKDQIESLQRFEIPATYINSTLSNAEQKNRLDNLANNKYRLVYIAPERLRSVNFLRALKIQKTSLLVVDEAHCISEWGHDFRPDYLEIVKFRNILKKPLTVALTATATPQVQNDIILSVGLGDSTVRIVTGFDRPNLILNVLYTNGTASKLSALNELLTSTQTGSVIIYTGTRRDAEEVADFVREVVKLPAEFYHAGLQTEKRTRIQNGFISGKINIITATNAFGMGIDRSDVRQVIHYSLPSSLEAYYQEVGRAGRDGLPARVTLLYDPKDRALQEFFIEQSTVAPASLRTIYNQIRNRESRLTVDDISMATGLHPVQIKVGLAELERANVLTHLGDEGPRMLFKKESWDASAIVNLSQRNKEHLGKRRNQLEGIVRYAETDACRREIILNHFGDREQPKVEQCCDNCMLKAASLNTVTNTAELTFNERTALVIIDCIYRCKIQVGKGKLVQILRGSKAKDILKFKHNSNVYYGRLAGFRQDDICALIEQLIILRYIKVIGSRYPILSLTPIGENAIQQKIAIPLEMPKGMAVQSIQHKRAQRKAGGTAQYTAKLLSDGLKPEKIARERGLEASTIYGHIVKLIEDGKVSVRQVIPAEMHEKIEAAILKVGSTIYISLIKALLPEEISFNMIKCVIAANRLQKPTENLLNKKQPDAIEAFLSHAHPRQLIGAWQHGWALDFHSRFSGGDWSRSGTGDLTNRLKYNSDLSVLPKLLEQTMELFQIHPEMNKSDIIVPVPSTTKRKIQPVQVYCDALSSKTKMPVQMLIYKTCDTKPQKEMKTIGQKRANVSGAFALNSNIQGKRILLVDDLFDSGATLDEITRVLRKGGAAIINVLTLT